MCWRVFYGSYTIFSFFVAILVILKEGTNIIHDSFMLNILIISTFYLISIYLVATISGKSPQRRLLSWLYSVLFHLSLLLYLAFLTELGIAALVVGIVETLILVLSVIGLSSHMYTRCNERQV